MNRNADPAYRQAVRLLAAGDYRCWHGCGRRATSPDHVPALIDHDHTPGSGCCELRPSCPTCNYSSGAAVGNRRRRARSLTPGAGWSTR